MASSAGERDRAAADPGPLLKILVRLAPGEQHLFTFQAPIAGLLLAIPVELNGTTTHGRMGCSEGQDANFRLIWIGTIKLDHAAHEAAVRSEGKTLSSNQILHLPA